MPRRWGVNTRLWAYRYLVLRDGEFCNRCRKIPTTQNSLDIDHINGVEKDDAPSNLRLLCRRCNVILGNQARPHRGLPSAQRERERSQGKPATAVAKGDVPYREGGPEMQANLLFEVPFRSWLLTTIREQKEYLKSEAINSGAEIIGCSPTTTSKYLSKLTSSQGPLKETKDLLGHSILIFKDHLVEDETIPGEGGKIASAKTVGQSPPGV